MKSRYLRVRVVEAGRPKVDLTFRAALAESLPDLIPEGLGPKLVARAIDVHAIARNVVNRDFEPGDLFQLTEGNQQFRVWLE